MWLTSRTTTIVDGSLELMKRINPLRTSLLLTLILVLLGTMTHARGGMRHGKSVEALVFSPDGKLLASADKSGELKVWSVDSERLLWSKPAGALNRIIGPDSNRSSLIFSGDGQILFTADREGRFKPLNSSSGDPADCFGLENEDPITAFAGSSGGRMLAVASKGGIRVLRQDSGNEVARWDRSQMGQVFKLEFSRDGNRLAAYGSHSCTLCEIETGKVSTFYTGSPASLTPDFKLLATGVYDMRVFVKEVGSEETLFSLGPDPQSTSSSREVMCFVQNIVCSADGSKMAWTARAQVFIWEVGHDWDVLQGYPVNCLAFAPDGRLATGDMNGEIKLVSIDER
jgi:WD40 repeat protein